MASFSVDAQATDAGMENSITENSISENSITENSTMHSAVTEHVVLDRQVRVIYPSPYEGVSRPGIAVDAR